MLRDLWSDLRFRLRALFNRASVERDLNEELSFHLEAEVERRARDGHPLAEARRDARMEHGGAEVVKESVRDARGTRWIENVLRDLQFAARSLGRTASFSVAVIFTLAIVIGANAAIFGIVDTMYLRRLSLPHAEQLVAVRRGDKDISVRYANFRDLRSSPGVPRLEGYRFEPVTSVANGVSEDIYIDLVTGGYFDLLGARPILGRAISAADEQTAAPVAVISEEFWRQRFGSNPDVLGRTMRLNDVTVTVVGVMPSDFTGIHFARRFHVALPFTLSPVGFPNIDGLAVNLIGRLDASRSVDVQAAETGFALQHCCADPMQTGGGSRRFSGVRATPTEEMPGGEPSSMFGTMSGGGPAVILSDASHGLIWGVDFRGRYRSLLLACMAGALLLLLIAIANVTTLLAARTEAREREFAVRLSLGASRWRVTQQLLAEALELTAIGAALGLLAAWSATPAIARGLPPSQAGLGAAISRSPSLPMLVVTAGVAVAVTIIVSIWPALRAGRADVARELAGGSRRLAPRWPAYQGLIVVQVAVALVLVSSASLFVITVRNLTRFEGGYHTRRILLAHIQAQGCASSPTADLTRCDRVAENESRRKVYDLLSRDAGELPGVESATLAMSAPVWRDALSTFHVRVPGSVDTATVFTRMNETMPGFFAATGVAIVAGRDFRDSDVENSEPVVIVSESFAKRYYGGRSAVDQVLEINAASSQSAAARIVGVARDANYDRAAGGRVEDLRNEEREICYVPMNQTRYVLPFVTLIVRTSGDPAALESLLRKRVAQIPDIKLSRLTSLGAVLDEAAGRERVAAGLATSFGIVALILAAMGIAAVLAYSVARRTREIGVRVALGARPLDALLLVMRQTLVMIGIGVALGAPIAIAAGRLVRVQLYGVTATDPRVFLAGVVMLALAGCAGAYVPGRRATSVDPLVALRAE